MSRQGAAPASSARFQDQATHEFRDESGTFSYEFSNVYGPPEQERRGSVCALDEDRSYWSIVGRVDEMGEELPPRRLVSYADARKAYRGRLSFAQFASEMYMRPRLPKFL
jgi:hypothetical protein